MDRLDNSNSDNHESKVIDREKANGKIGLQVNFLLKDRTFSTQPNDIHHSEPLDHNQASHSNNANNEEQAKDRNRSIWPFIMLFGSLVVSVANTLLLSFISRSIHLGDVGLMDEKIVWDRESKSNVLELATFLPENDIEAESIESSGDKPMRLIIKLDKSMIEEAERLDSGEATGLKKFLRENSKTHNYLALNYYPNSSSEEANEASLRHALEIGTRMLILNLIKAKKGTKGGQQEPATVNRLLEMDTETDTLTLDMQNRLDIHGSSLGANDKLVCPNILGSLEKNLDIQARDGNLVCQSGETVQLVSKSGDIRLSSSNKMVFNSESIKLNSSTFYMTKGIHYFESKLEKSQSSGSSSNLRAFDLVQRSDGQLKVTSN